MENNLNENTPVEEKDKKTYLDYEGLAYYDRKIKDYIDDKNDTSFTWGELGK